MGHVQVSADNHRFGSSGSHQSAISPVPCISFHHSGQSPGVESADIFPECVFPFHPVVQPFGQFPLHLGILRIGSVAADQIEVLVFQSNNPAFPVVFIPAYTEMHRQRLSAGIDRHSRIAFFLGIVPVACVTGELEVNLSLLKFRFLQTYIVGIKVREYVREAFAADRTQTVHVPGYEFCLHSLFK